MLVVAWLALSLLATCRATKPSVLVLEKENDVGDVTSMANSAIVHSGDDPVPGTLKAKFNVLGNAMFDSVSDELDVEFSRVGSINLATKEEQAPALAELEARAKENGVPCRYLSGEEVLALEPNVNPEVKAGLLCPTAGIVNPFTLTAHAMENACDNGVEPSSRRRGFEHRKEWGNLRREDGQSRLRSPHGHQLRRSRV